MNLNIYSASFKTTLLLYISVLLVILYGCNSNSTSTENAELSADATEPNTYSITKTQAKNIKLQIETLKEERVVQSITVSGNIDVPPGSITAYNFPIPVYISDLDVYEGSFVKKGKPLFTIAHPGLLALQKNFIAAKAQLSSMKAEWDRQKALFSQEATAGKKVAEAEATYRVAESAYLDLQSKLKNIGIDAKDVLNGKTMQKITIVAKQDGVVGEILVKNNTLVPMETSILQVTDITHKHLELLVPEADGQKIVEGQEVDFVLLNNQSKKYQGHIYLTSKEIDRNTGLMNIHAHLENESDTELKPGAAVKAQITLGEMNTFRLPIESVVEYKAVPHIFEFVGESGENLVFKLLPIKAKMQEGFYIFEDDKALNNKKIVVKNADFLFTHFLQSDEEEE